MPFYSYKCKNCGCGFEILAPMKDSDKKQPCPNCSKSAERDIAADHNGGVMDSQMREYTMEGSTGTRMYGASYLPQQLEVAKKKHPGRDFKLVNGAYLPVIKHRRDKLRYLKEYGNYVEYD